MSSVAVFSPAVLPSFSDQDAAESLESKRVRAVGALSSSVRTASTLEVRPAPAMIPFGIASLDELTGGVPRGALTELVGPASSGRSSVTLSLIASVTRRQEVCAFIDVTDSFDPASAEAAGIDLDRLLWVRCGKTGQCTVDSGQKYGASLTRTRTPTMNSVAPPAKNISWSIHENYDARLRHAITGEFAAQGGRVGIHPQVTTPAKMRALAAAVPTRNAKPETRNLSSKWTKLDQALKATDLLLQSGGFGLIVIDLGDISIEQARRVPLTSWFRFRRVVENTPTILLLIARDSCAKTCASLVLQLGAQPLQSGQMLDGGQKQSGVSSRQSVIRALSTVDRPLLSHVNLLDGLNVHVELLRTRLERKPVRSTGSLQTQTSWRRSG
jgi:recombination protein RecA